MKKSILIIFLCCVLAVTLSANEKAAEFNVLFYPGKMTVNPHTTVTMTEAQIFTAIFEGLVSYDPVNLKPRPGIASEWEINEEGTEYVFTIRENANYRNGDEVTASHLRQSWIHLLKPSTNADYAFLLDVIKGARDFRNGRIDDPSKLGIYAEDKRTLRIELVSKAPHFLQILCHHSLTVVHPDMLGIDKIPEPDDILTNGPFQITQISEEELLLEAVDSYWDSEAVKLGKINIYFTDDDTAISQSYNLGQYHWVADGGDFDLIKNKQAIVLNPLFSTNYYFFSCADEPYNDPRVRSALVRLLPLEKLRDDQYIPGTSLVPPFSAYPEVEGITEKDTAKALADLEAQGITPQTALPDIVFSIPQGEAMRNEAQVIKNAWEKELNVEVTIAEKPYYSYYDSLMEGDFTIATITWVGDFADPLTFLGMWTSDSNINNSQYSSDEYDSIIETSMGLEGKPRYELLAEAEELLLKEGAVLPVSHSPALNIINRNMIEGWYPNPLDIHPFKYIRFSDVLPLDSIAKSD